MTGSGVAVVQVDPKSGHVTSARILESTGHIILDDAALKAFRQWRFKPGATSEVHIPISYVMRGYTSNAPNTRTTQLEPQVREAFRRQDYDATIRSATQALQLAPGKVSLRELRALAYYRKGNNDAAIRDYNEVIRLNPTSASAYRIIGQQQLAARDLREAVRLAPNDAGTIDALAWFLATCPEERVRNGTEAVSTAKKACDISHWTDSDHIDTLAAAYAEVAEFDQATKYQQQSLNDPSLAPKARKEREERLQLYQLRKPYRDRLEGST